MVLSVGAAPPPPVGLLRVTRSVSSPSSRVSALALSERVLLRELAAMVRVPPVAAVALSPASVTPVVAVRS